MPDPEDFPEWLHLDATDRPDRVLITSSTITTSGSGQRIEIGPPIRGTLVIPGMVSIDMDTGAVTTHPGYEPDAAARAFWDAIELMHTGPQSLYGATQALRIDAELAKGQETERKLQAILEAVFVWRDRPGGDIGLAMQLATILGNDVPQPPASAALVRVLKEVDRLERQARHDRDDATLEALRRIRDAADTTTPEPATPATPAPPGS